MKSSKHSLLVWPLSWFGRLFCRCKLQLCSVRCSLMSRLCIRVSKTGRFVQNYLRQSNESLFLIHVQCFRHTVPTGSVNASNGKFYKCRTASSNAMVQCICYVRRFHLRHCMHRPSTLRLFGTYCKSCSSCCISGRDFNEKVTIYYWKRRQTI